MLFGHPLSPKILGNRHLEHNPFLMPHFGVCFFFRKTTFFGHPVLGALSPLNFGKSMFGRQPFFDTSFLGCAFWAPSHFSPRIAGKEHLEHHPVLIRLFCVFFLGRYACWTSLFPRKDKIRTQSSVREPRSDPRLGSAANPALISARKRLNPKQLQ